MSNYWNDKLREIRHNPCLMRPVTAFILITISLLMLVSLLFQFPGFLLGLLIAPLNRRSAWLIEFLYPSSLARWGHIFLLRLGARTRNASISVQVEDASGKTGGLVLKSVPLHSRAIEQRIEVVLGRVFIHPLPQLLDNIGYLIVGLPAPSNASSTPIIAILIDCGEADSVKNQIHLIQKLHYPNYNIQLHLILSTHKHHDHTAGIRALASDPKFNRHLKYICGGAVENVPCCNYPLANGDKIPITSFTECANDMESLIEIECISVPCHTRGSTVFALSNKVPFNLTKQSSPFHQRKYLFTGDALFSGGGGVPFEADLEFPNDRNLYKKTPYSIFRPGGGSHALERCFIEILIRSSTFKSISQLIAASREIDSSRLKDEVLLFPGHEYTTSLLQRQLDVSAVNQEPLGNNQWGKLEPSYFFEVASNFFIANHRRSLPKTMRLLTVPTSMETQLKINPTYRLLRYRGEQLISAIKVWYQHHGTKKSKTSSFLTSSSKKSSISSDSVVNMSKRSSTELTSSIMNRTPSTKNSWNQDYTDIQRSVFTTVYSSDLEKIIEGLNGGTLDPKRAALKLSQLSSKLDDHVLIRSPVPGTLPNDKLMFLGILALSALGSPPTAMTEPDSRLMKLGSPVHSSDFVLISKNRLIHSLRLLGLVAMHEFTIINKEEEYIGVADKCLNRNSVGIVEMIHLLWEEARSSTDIDARLIQKKNKIELKSQPLYDSVDMEKRNCKEGDDRNDLIELGILKLCLYSIPPGLPQGLPQGFPMRCLPCGKSSIPSTSSLKDDKMNIKRSGGELISHDVATCSICRGSQGCPECSVAEMESYEDDLLLVEERQKHPVEKKSSTKDLPRKRVEKNIPLRPQLSSQVDDADDTVEIVLDKKNPKK